MTVGFEQHIHTWGTTICFVFWMMFPCGLLSLLSTIESNHNLTTVGLTMNAASSNQVFLGRNKNNTNHEGKTYPSIE